ncbi:MAG: Na(+)-translocating NADH-quinone reductase subunit A [Bacteroidales bacterium]
MVNHIRLKKGLDIPLMGEAQLSVTKKISPKIIAVKPTDFKALTPKLLVKEGDQVSSGAPLLADKENPSIKLCTPLGGRVKSIIRGEKRKLLAVTVEVDHSAGSIEHKLPPLDKGSRKEIIELLMESGLWVSIKQRPYGTAPNPQVVPKAIFISGFDSAPLAPNIDFVVKGEIESIERGIQYLSKLTSGEVHLSLHASDVASSPLHKLNNIVLHSFDGPHPSGTVGVQINKIMPIGKGDTIWTVDIHSLIAIGRLFSKGHLDLKRVIAVTGPRAKNPSYIETLPGTSMEEIASFEEGGGERSTRYISGNVLTGNNVGKEGFLGFFHNQITLLEEGDYYEMLGWIKPFRLKKFSTSRSYFSWLFPKKQYSLDTNLNGGERSFVMTNIYERVTPIDIYPTHLLKAILAHDIDKMERLGIYEVIEEDLALCEFVCPSKIEVQQIVSQGLDLMIKEMS